MGLETGTKVGVYEIQGRLGAGGMGEVYRARDSRLQRSVAIKILKGSGQESPETRKRLHAEARAISALQHPNICTLYDVGQQDGLDYLVMECLDGETLAQRLARGPLQVSEFLKCAIEICDGLERAHANGVIHCDLKPGNIMLTRSGTKIMDFGLARVTLSCSNDGATLSSPLTAANAIAGTLSYMAPEQVEGSALDERSDIFSLGAVLHEMATGQLPFSGKSSASVIAAILERDSPPIRTVRPEFPHALSRIVQLCLKKKPDERWRSVHDIKLQMMQLKAELDHGNGTEEIRRPPWQKSAWALAAVAVISAVLLGMMFLGRPTPRLHVTRTSILPPAHWSFLRSSAVISPDGTWLAFVGVGPNGETALWVRSLISGAYRQLAPADFASVPFWSPDSTRIGFFAESKLKIIDAAGGPAQALCSAPFGRGGAWNSSGTIIFAPLRYGPLYRVSDKGGEPIQLTKLSSENSPQRHAWPVFLPDGKHFLYSVDNTPPGDPFGNGIYVGSLDGSAPKLVTADFTGNVSFAQRRLLFVRDLTLMSQPFDADTFKLNGAEEPVSEQQVPTYEPMSLSSFSASAAGVIVYESLADLRSQLLWLNAHGVHAGQIPASNASEPRISPDGRQVVFVSDEGMNGKTYIHLYDIARNVETRLTDQGHEWSPAWSPDSKNIAFVSRQGKTYQIFKVAADGSAAPELLLEGAEMKHLDWGPNGEIVYSDFTRGRSILSVFSISQRKARQTYPGAEPRFSPDGHSIAYTLGFRPGAETALGGNSGPEIFVQAFPGPGARTQISRNGGAQAVWSASGKQIFFIAPDKKLMAVEFNPKTQSAGPPRALFQTDIIAPEFIDHQLDVARDGRFLINSLPQGSAPAITVISNWTGEAKQ